MRIFAKTSLRRLLASLVLEVLDQYLTQGGWTRETKCTTMVTFNNRAGVAWPSQETCQSARSDRRAVPSTPHSKRDIGHSINVAAFDRTIRYTSTTMPQRAVRMLWTKVRPILEWTNNQWIWTFSRFYVHSNEYFISITIITHVALDA